MEVNGNTRNNDTSNRLRELLKVEQDEDDDDSIGNGNGNGRNYVPRQALGSVINVNKRSLTSVQSNRTLLDIIREDSSTKEKKTWKHFKEKLRRKKPGSGAAWTSSVHIPASDVIPMQPNVNSASMNNRTMMRRHSTRIPDGGPELTHNLSRRSSVLQRTDSTVPHDPIVVEHNADEQRRRSEEGEEEEGMGEMEEGNNNGEEGAVPVRMSLMDLLSETDSNYMNGDEDDDEEEEEEEEESSERNVESGGEYNNCCVCMVRHKGAAFIPCGHTFCRLCSRELYVQRNYCPLCNGYILEILDIF